MKTTCIFIFFCAFFAASLTGQTESPDDLFLKANRLYQSGKFSEAAAEYQQIADREYVSAELFYNLGNAFYKLNRYGFAVFYYEKARRLDPKNEDIQFNLELAQLHVKDRIITPPDFFVYEFAKRFLHMLSTEGWALVALILLYATVTAALINTFISEGAVSRTARKLRPVLSILFLCFGTLFALSVYRNSSNREAVILYSTADIKNEPDSGSPTVFVLHEGSKVEIRSEKENWFEIKLADGKVGWIKHDELGLL